LPRHGGFLLCRELMVSTPASVATMYSTTNDSITIHVKVHSWHQTTETLVLLDSGATHNFIDERAVNKLSLGTKSLPQPIQVNNVDSTHNQSGAVRRYCNL